MRPEVLTAGQIKLLPLLKSFTNDFGLVGGTAIALYLGHRQSIDFDLFTDKKFNNLKIRRQIVKLAKIEKTIINDAGEYTVLVQGIKITFLLYPFRIKYNQKFKDIIKLPDLLTLAAMKAYALGRRAKWKDYVDLYFIIKDHYSIRQIIKKGQAIFGAEFNEKRFKSQLAYFKDIDYSEKVIYLKDFAVNDEIIKKSLVDFSLD